MIISLRKVKAFIVILSSVILLSCSSETDTTANTLGKDIIYQYYRSFPGTEEIDFQYKKAELVRFRTEFLKKYIEINKKTDLLYKDCPKACVNEINSLTLEAAVYNEKINNINNIYEQNVTLPDDQQKKILNILQYKSNLI